MRDAGQAAGRGSAWRRRTVLPGLFAEQVDVCTADLLLYQLGLILRWFVLKN